MAAQLLSSMGAQGSLQQGCFLPPPIKMKNAMAAAVCAKQAGCHSSLIHTPLRLSLHHTCLHRRLPCHAQASSNITFHFDNTAVTVPFSQDAALRLSKSIEDVLNTFREKEKAVRPRRWENMEFRHTEDGTFVEFFCNPNAYANLFQAKVLLTINDEKMKIVSEAQLSAIKTEVDQYVKAKV
eukprot:c2089_g1_i1 orf=64-609(+)